MRLPRWPVHVFLGEIKKLISYRTEFWIQYVGSVSVSIFVAYFLWSAIFEANHATQIGGFSFDAMMLYYVMVPFVDRCVRVNEMGTLSPDIYDGSFTRYLVYPLSAIGYKYVSNLAVSALGFGQFLVGLSICLIIFKVPPEVHLSPLSFLMGFISIVFAGVLYFLLTSCLELVAFWTDNVWSLLVMLRFTSTILGGSTVPLSLLPPGMRSFVEFLPFSYLTSFPIQVITGQRTSIEWANGLAATTGWIVFAFFVCQLIMNRGVRRYTGVGI